MADRIRFHLDEHVDPSIASALRRAGIDVTTTIDAGLRTKNDEAQLQFARSGRRVLVTRDQDFLRIAAQMTITMASCSTPRISQFAKSLKGSF